MAEVRTRTSCDRCRSQKLRCVPSSDDDPTAPCQRCLKAKVPAACFFGPRSRPGRSSQGTEKSKGRLSVNVKETKPSLPGMSTFSLDDAPETSQGHTNRLVTPASSVDPDHMPEMSWQGEESTMPGLDFLSETPPDYEPIPLLEALATSDPLEEGLYTAASTHAFNIDHFNGLLPPDGAEAVEGGEPVNTVAPIVDINDLITRMLQFEKSISNFTAIDIDDYPIGDAISLSKCLHAVISAPHSQPGARAAPHSSVLDRLLATSGFIVLLRIYASVFTFLCDRLRGVATTMDQRTCHEQPSRELYTYRGLRLSQLGPTCLCRTWQPAKKAFSLLSQSLSDIEEVFGFSPPLRVVTTAFSKTTVAEAIPSTPSLGAGRRLDSLLDDSVLMDWTDGSLYSALCEQTDGLRGIATELESLLGGSL